MNEIGTSVREREIYKVTLVGSLVNILLVVWVSVERVRR